MREAQFAVLSRLIPLMYFILVSNAWGLGITFVGRAPAALVLGPLLAFTVLSAVRLVAWWKRRRAVPTAELAARELRRTNLLAALLGPLFTTWAFLLFPYGDDFAQGHVAFFLAFTMLGSMLCLIHAPGASFWIALTSGVPYLTFFLRSGNPVLVATSAAVLLVTGASLLVIRIHGRDFQRMVRAREEAARREYEQSRLLRMIDGLPLAVMTIDPATRTIDYANAAARALVRSIEHLLPVGAEAFVGSSVDAFCRGQPELQRQMSIAPAAMPCAAKIAIGAEILELQTCAITDSRGEHLGAMLTWALITPQVQAERRIRQLAHYDSLTGLLNRHAFREQMQIRLERPEPAATVLMIDLDGFKAVNDTLGHRVGDQLLAEVANRLRARCKGQAVAVARLGGDEFAVLLPGDDAAAAEAFAQALVTAIAAPYALAHRRQVRIGASIGIALAPLHGADGETLLGRADIALYVAKAAGKGVAKLFTAEMSARLHGRVRLEARLRAALESGTGLYVFFQPIVDLASGRVTAREALLRWHHPRRGWIEPAEFMPVAEETGLIERLGPFVLQQACDEAVGWADRARVAVNVSAAQFGKGTLIPAVREALRRSGLPADRLELEIAETALLERGREVTSELKRLRELGVRLALDDFGTGYSSLTHLRSVAFDRIKIDGSFVRDAVERADGAAVVHAVAALGRRLGVRIVAEGVETRAHLDGVRREGCEEVQGYLLGRPLPRPCDERAVQVLDELPMQPANSMFAETMI